MNKSRLTPMGRRIFVGMVAAGIATEAELARRARMSPQAVQRWLYGPMTRIDARVLFRISDTVRLSARWLVNGKGSPAVRRPVTPTEAKILREYAHLSPGCQTIIQHCLAQLGDLG